MKGRRRAFAFAGAGLLAAATAALFLVSRGKWSDAIIDSGSEWFVPDALARGELLYRDVIHWFGPFTPYLHAVVFRLFGSSFASLVAAGAAGSLALCAALWLGLKTVTGRSEAVLATALAVPTFVFMPAAGGALLGMGFRMWHAALFTLLAVALAARPPAHRARGFGLGVLCALAGLCRIEWGAAALLGVMAAAAARERFRPRCLRDIVPAAAAFALVLGSVVGGFVAVAGRSAVLEDGHLLFTGLPPETRRFLFNISGLQDPKGGLLRLLASFAAWLAVILSVELGATWKEGGSKRRQIGWLLAATLFFFLNRDAAGTPSMIVFSAAPLVGLLACAVGLRRGHGTRAAALVGFGLLAAVLSYRKIFSIQEGPYVGPPLVFALVAGTGLLRQVVLSRSPGPLRERLGRAIQVFLLALVVLAFAVRFVQYGADTRVVLPGTNGMLSADPETVRALSLVAETIRTRTPADSGLVVFPEGAVLQVLAGRSNPLRHWLTIPGYLTDANEGAVLAELERARPEAIVIVRRDTGVYGRKTFGEHYGRRIAAWIGRNYELAAFDPLDRKAPGPASPARLFFRR